MTRATYKRAEKLKSRKQIDLLFSAKQSFSQYPIRVSYLLQDLNIDEKASIKVGVGTSKRNYKKAVDRNRIKRLLRESWRLNKAPLFTEYKNEAKTLIIFFHYYSKTILQQELLHEKMILAIKNLIVLLNETNR